MVNAPTLLEQLGWQAFFIAQTDGVDLGATPPVRVMEVHRSEMTVRGQDVDAQLSTVGNIAVGDWLLLNPELPSHSQRLERKSLLKRKAAGNAHKEQLIVANLDTLFIVTSCNDDFNVARLERYLAIAFEAEVEAVIVLTKIDQCADIAPFVAAAQSIAASVPVVALNAKAEGAEALRPWCGLGQTVAFMGSSGVGKSTLVNALLGHTATRTAAIREDDAKGRHTTTARQLYLMESGGLLIDTPGIRELQITDVSAGLADVFSDIDALTENCKFRDCQHEAEPQCAVKKAVQSGELSPDRLARWRKLQAEDRLNTATIHDKRAQDKSFHKSVRAAYNAKRNKL